VPGRGLRRHPALGRSRKIAEALRVTLSPQEQADPGVKPTGNLQAYDLYLRGKSYARRLTKQDLKFARQMFDII
jgi:hypothetical protein